MPRPKKDPVDAVLDLIDELTVIERSEVYRFMHRQYERERAKARLEEMAVSAKRPRKAAVQPDPMKE